MVDGDTLLPHRASVMSSTPRTDTPAQVHFNESLFHTALPTAISLNDGGLKGNLFGFLHLKCDVFGSDGEITIAVAAAIALALLIALIPGSLGQLVGL